MTPPTKGAVIERTVSERGAVDHEEPDGAAGEAVQLSEKLVVSPCAGKFQPPDGHHKKTGEYVVKGQEVGKVFSSDCETVSVTSAFSGWIMGYLIPEGSPVRSGEPVAWISP